MVLQIFGLDLWIYAVKEAKWELGWNAPFHLQ